MHSELTPQYIWELVFHLLLFEFREPSNGNAWFSLGIGSQSGTAQLERLRITGMEDGAFQSNGIINPDFTAGINYASTIILSSLVFANNPVTITAGTFVGLVVSGVGTTFSLSSGQAVSRYNQVGAGPSSNNVQLFPTSYPMPNVLSCGVYPYPTGIWGLNDIVFMGFSPGSGLHCGLTRVALQGTLVATYTRMIQGNFVATDFPIGQIQVTLCIPWFIWSSSS